MDKEKQNNFNQVNNDIRILYKTEKERKKKRSLKEEAVFAKYQQRKTMGKQRDNQHN